MISVSGPFFHRPSVTVNTPVISTAALTSGTVGSAYSQTLTETGGTAAFTWLITGGALPAGLSLAGSTGIISGTPTASGTFSVTIRVTDSVALYDEKTFSLVIAVLVLRGVIEMELAGRGNGWTVNSDVILGITYHRGLPGNRILDCVADISSLLFTCDSSENSSGGLGYYSMDHASCRAGWALGIGIRYRIGPKIRFTGILDSADAVPGRHGRRVVECEALGWMDTATRTALVEMPVLVDKRADEVVQYVIDSLKPFARPRAFEKDLGADVFSVVLDRVRDEVTMVRDEFYRIAVSGGIDRIWERGDGTLVYESRTRRAAVAVDSDTFQDSHGFVPSRARGSIINSVQVTTHSRVASLAERLLFSISTPIAINPGETKVIQGNWTDPDNPDIRVAALTLTPIVSGTDYYAITSIDSPGIDITHELIVTVGLSGNSTLFTIYHDGADPGFIVTLQQRGFPLYDYGPSTIPWRDEVSIGQYGVKSQPIDMKYQSDVKVALAVAQYTVYTNSKVSTQVPSFRRMVSLSDNAELNRSINRDISDRIRIEDETTGIGKSFFINAIDETEAEGILTTEWTLVTADTTAFWRMSIVGHSELNSTTIVGFGQILGHTDVSHGDVHGDVAHGDVLHVDAHTDSAHVDIAHGDSSGVHGDSVHQDTMHGDTSHVDSHGDSSHNDSPHGDVPYTNSHSDVPHSDVAHGDTAHTDVQHNDTYVHVDYTNGDYHDDTYVHVDGPPHEDIGHTDVHNDVAHADVHNDSAHVDEAHEDFSHSDTAHGDTNHVDTVHVDVPHNDGSSHSDTPDGNIPHGDVAHADIAHDDVTHSDSHTDVVHGDVN